MTQHTVKTIAEKISDGGVAVYVEAFARVIERLSRTEVFLRERLSILSSR